MIGEQLQGYDVENGRERTGVVEQVDDVNAITAFDARVTIGKDEKLAAACADLLEIGLQFFDQAIVGCDNDHGHL